MLRRFTRGKYGELDYRHLNGLADVAERAARDARRLGADLRQQYRRLMLIETFPALLGAPTTLTADQKWEYDFDEATLDGDNGWGALTGGRTQATEGIKARNYNEVLTVAQQEALYLGSLGSFVRKPVPVGRPVTIEVYTDADNDLALWFDAANPLEPSCAAPALSPFPPAVFPAFIPSRPLVLLGGSIVIPELAS